MQELINTNSQTITSLEIAKLTGKEHHNILKAIRNMEDAWIKTTGVKFNVSEYKDSTGRKLPMYRLTKVECLYVATKFNDEARAKLVLRWEHLENRTSNLIQDSRVQIVELLNQFILDVGSANKASAALKVVSAATISHMIQGKWEKIADTMWRNVESSIKNWYRLRQISPEIYKDVFSSIVENHHLPTLKSKLIHFIAKSRDKEIKDILIEYHNSLDEMERKM